jgi:hypothetical protein
MLTQPKPLSQNITMSFLEVLAGNLAKYSDTACIDAAALLEDVRQLCLKLGADARQLVIPFLYSQIPTWIPVEVELPGAGEPILVWDGQMVREAVFMKESGGKFYGHSGHKFNLPFVTHWMPRPIGPSIVGREK